MRRMQQVAVRESGVRLCADDKGERQDHLVFHNAKPRDDTAEPLVRQMKPEWVPLLDALMQRNKGEGIANHPVLRYPSPSYLTGRLKHYLKTQGLRTSLTPYNFRHTASQMMADAGKPRVLIQEFLGHSSRHTPNAYIQPSTNQTELINTALAPSLLYP